MERPDRAGLEGDAGMSALTFSRGNSGMFCRSGCSHYILLQEFQLDSRELTCKLSGLELAGSGRSNDSGVASPSEEDHQEDRREGTKTRTQSGEDAGIGSEQGQFRLHPPLPLVIIKTAWTILTWSCVSDLRESRCAIL